MISSVVQRRPVAGAEQDVQQRGCPKSPGRTWRGLAAALAAAFLTGLSAHPALAQAGAPSAPRKVLQMPMRTDGPKSLDPVKGSTQYDNIAASQVYETLLQYKYLKRPYELEPLLLERMPEISPDGLTWRFTLKPGVRFKDDACFPGGVGREVKSADVFYSWKRMADDANLPKSWWLFENTIKGFDAYRAAQNAARDGGGRFDYDAPVEGLRIVDDRVFEVVLMRPVQQFAWKLAMFQTSVVAREAVEHYGDGFGRNPVGTGPFMLVDWKEGVSMVLARNPTYREALYPPASEAAEADVAASLTAAAGRRLPLVDRVEVTMFVQDQPMWLQFKAGNLAYVEVPAENFEEAFNKRTKKLRPAVGKAGIQAHSAKLLDFIFDGFNMEDPLVGGYTKEKIALRRAISLALDYDEINESFYNGLNVVYDGPIPPGLDGHPEDGRAPASARGRDLDKARAALAEAGYPGGKGLPKIDYYTSRGGNNQEQSEMRRRQLEAIGVQLNVNLVDFSTLIEKVNRKGAPMFSFAWGSDYPDAENNLALFYGPFEAPGSNHYNYKRADYDALYERIQTMPPGPERTAVYIQMRDMILSDAPYCGSMARERFYLVNPWAANLKPDEVFSNWWKYIDVDDARRGVKFPER